MKEGRLTVVGPRRTRVNKEAAAASDDDQAALGERTPCMLHFGGMGLNCEALS